MGPGVGKFLSPLLISASDGLLACHVKDPNEPAGNRTLNPQLKRLLLCQLSYRPSQVRLWDHVRQNRRRAKKERGAYRPHVCWSNSNAEPTLVLPRSTLFSLPQVEQHCQAFNPEIHYVKWQSRSPAMISPVLLDLCQPRYFATTAVGTYRLHQHHRQTEKCSVPVGCIGDRSVFSFRQWSKGLGFNHD